jgi:multiple sugar transport system substrate-binding protein
VIAFYYLIRFQGGTDLKKLLSIVMILVMMAPLIFAAGRQEEENQVVELELYWESGDLQSYERDILQTLIDEYQNTHPNVRIKNNPFIGDAEDYQAKLLTRLRSGSGPDIYTVGDNTIFRYAKGGMAAKVPDALANSLQSQIPESLRSGMTTALSWEGSFYGVPWNADWVSLWYNRDAFEEAGLDPDDPPRTLEELREYAKKLTIRENGRIVRSGISLRATTGGSGQTDKWINFLTASGGRLFNDDMTRTLVNNKAGVSALQYYLTLLYEDKVDAVDLEPRDSEGFAQGKTAMFGRGPWVLSFLRDAAPDLNYDVAPFPGESMPFVDGLVINPDSPSIDAAWEFVSWFMEPENFGRWQEELNSVPLLTEVAKRPYFQQNEILAAFSQQPLTEVPQHERLLEMKTILGDYMAKAVYLEMTPQEALDQAAAEINAILAE